jgi:hypothetical protein
MQRVSLLALTFFLLTLFHIDNTNSAKLELYSVIGEVDNAGFPLAYCFLSTATSISAGKRTRALKSFLQSLQKAYDIQPQFAHVDKDFAEISALRQVWPDATVTICWWHLRDALRKRTSSNLLSTSKYNPVDACTEFSFIDKTFGPPPGTKSNPQDNEEQGYSDDTDNTEDDPNYGKRPRKHVKKMKVKQNTSSTQPPPPTNPNSLLVKLAVPPGFQWSQSVNQVDASSSETNSGSDEGKEISHGNQRQFCPPELRQPLIDMVEFHFCTHSSVPGLSAPNKEGIRWWAVKQIWEFCVKYDLRELWAYMWVNWYRPDRWKLWARSQSNTIPRLKTTMICEAQYVLTSSKPFHGLTSLLVGDASSTTTLHTITSHESTISHGSS